MKLLNKKFLSNQSLFGIAPLILAWGIVLLIKVNVKTLIIVSADGPNHPRVYTDKELNGHSIASVNEVAGKGIVFTYTLKQGYIYPYAGICFDLKNGQHNMKYGSNFIIKIKTDAPKVIPIILNEQVSSFSGKTMLRPAIYELNIQPEKEQYVIPVEEFEVPAWWYKSNQVTEVDFAAFNPSDIKTLCIQNCLLTKLNKEEHIQVRELSNRPDMHIWIWTAAVFSLCWIAGCSIYLLIKKKKTAVFIPYVITKSESDPKDAWDEIRNYISLNYMNDIDMEGMEKALGIAKHKIAQVIKENTTLIFKQYLNQIKVAEAKRLLAETNLPIGEIADQVGFGHVSNFNRVFKQYTGESPSELRAGVTIK